MSLPRIFIGCCLALAVALFAVNAVAQQPPAKQRIANGVTSAGQDLRV